MFLKGPYFTSPFRPIWTAECERLLLFDHNEKIVIATRSDVCPQRARTLPEHIATVLSNPAGGIRLSRRQLQPVGHARQIGY